MFIQFKKLTRWAAKFWKIKKLMILVDGVTRTSNQRLALFLR